MPKLTWKHETVNGKLRLTIESTPAPNGARLWIAQTPTKDFRTAKWIEQAVSLSEGKVIGEVPLPDKGHVAFFGELDYEVDGVRYRLSTQMRVTE
jgi:PhoPQ-activated pathogenicity-related protein